MFIVSVACPTGRWRCGFVFGSVPEDAAHPALDGADEAGDGWGPPLRPLWPLLPIRPRPLRPPWLRGGAGLGQGPEEREDPAQGAGAGGDGGGDPGQAEHPLGRGPWGGLVGGAPALGPRASRLPAVSVQRLLRGLPPPRLPGAEPALPGPPRRALVLGRGAAATHAGGGRGLMGPNSGQCLR